MLKSNQAVGKLWEECYSLQFDINSVVAAAFGFQRELLLVQSVEGDGSRYVIRFKVQAVSTIRYVADLFIVGDKVTSAVLFIDR